MAGGALVVLTVAVAAFALGNGFGSPPGSPTPASSGVTQASGSPGSGSSPSQAPTPSEPPATPTLTPVPAEIQPLLAFLPLDRSAAQDFGGWWMTDPTGDLQTVEGQPATYAPGFADITGFTALDGDVVGPHVFDAIVAHCGQAPAGGIQVVCGEQTAATVAANPTAALLVLTAFNGPLPPGFVVRPQSQCENNSTCVFFIQTFVDRDGDPANNAAAPPGQPNYPTAGADGEYVTQVTSATTARLVFGDLVTHKTMDTSAFLVVGERAAALVLFDVPKAVWVGTQALTFNASGRQQSFDTWDGYPSGLSPHVIKYLWSAHPS